MNTLPNYTPWGEPQDTEILLWANDKGEAVPCMWMVHTASHGGIYITEEMRERFLSDLPASCNQYNHGNGGNWFEEDCESCVPLYIFYPILDNSCWLIKDRYPRKDLLKPLGYMGDEAMKQILIAGEIVNALAL